MRSLDVEIVGCGSPLHIADLATLRARGLAIPHEYSSWPLHSTSGSWKWCRVLEPSGDLATGFAVHLNASRSIPGFRIGRVTRIGRELHEQTADEMGAVLRATADKIPRLLRLVGRVFDEDPVRRARLGDGLRAAGWSRRENLLEYNQTLVLRLDGSMDDVRRRFSRRVRKTIDNALSSPAMRFAPVSGAGYADRLRLLHTLPFARTGGRPPPLDVRGILADSQDQTSSLLVGAFVRDGCAPKDLVAFAWARLEGDHAVLELNASERSPLLRHLSPGFGLLARIIDWAIERRAKFFDLGGLSKMDPAANDPMRGIIEFKKRFSTDLREVADEWQLEPNPLLASASSSIRMLARITPFGSSR